MNRLAEVIIYKLITSMIYQDQIPQASRHHCHVTFVQMIAT